jgi:hypothetical protein
MNQLERHFAISTTLFHLPAAHAILGLRLRLADMEATASHIFINKEELIFG